jgi:CDGSH iron-sulfur domain-containing protein 3
MRAIVTRKGPYLQELAPGDYLWCACGRSANQPWCDGSHAGTTFTPVKFTIKPRRTPETVWLCGCRHSRSKPFCDGSHNRLVPETSQMS